MKQLDSYYQLIKPGIVYGNAIMTAAGFFLACAHLGVFDIRLLVAVVLGTSFVIASACVLNNFIDRDIDAKMKRTKKRATAARTISTAHALVYTVILGFIGFVVLALYTNTLTVLLGVVAYIAYIVLYGIAKRATVHGTLVGAISGGLPPAAGYVAVTNQLDIATLLLFLVLVAWQMPHFYAIAMRRRDDYAAAGIPVLPVVKGMQATRAQIIGYIALFIIANALFTIFGYTGYTYLVVMSLVGLAWFIKGAQGLRSQEDSVWALKMFLFSLIVLLMLCFMLAVGGLLP